MLTWAVVGGVLAAVVLLAAAVDRRERARARIWDGQVLPPPPRRPWRQAVAPYLACYAGFALLLVLEYAVFAVWRSTLLDLLGAFVSASEWDTALYGFGLVLLVMALLLFAMAAEPYLRAGVERRRVRERFLRLALLLVLAIGVGALLTWVAAAVMASR